MQYLPLGRAPLQVSRLALGGWQAHGWEKSSPTHFKRVIEQALDYGITLFDTAPAYGNGVSERLLGEVLGTKRANVVLATKFPHTADTPEKIRASLEQSLRDLKTDHVDIFMQHWPAKKFRADEMLHCLEALKHEGKILSIGVSNWMEPEWQELDTPSRVEVFEPCYNLLWRSIERSVLPLCHQCEIAVLCYSPLCQGLLTGQYDESRSWTDSRQRNILFKPAYSERRRRVLAELQRVATQHKRSCAQIAIAWLLAQKGVTSVLLGASDPSQLDELVKALEVQLSPADMDVLTASSDDFAKEWPPHESLWGWHSRK